MEHLSNFGYAMLGKQTNPTTPVIPASGLPLYSESITTNLNPDEDTRIAGHKMARHSLIMGQRSHTGDITFLAEPNTAGLVADMLLTKGSTSGSNPYTHPFTLDGSKNPNYYTLDIAKGDMVFRYWGVVARNLSIAFDANKGVFTAGVSAMGVFSSADISSVATNTLTLNSTCNAQPAKGLVVGDLVRITKAAGGTVDTTVSNITDTTVTVASATGVTSGDVLTLRKQTYADSLLFPVLWAKTEYRFGATPTDALSATHTPIEADSGTWNILHSLNTEGGEMRSGSFGPAGFARTTGDVEITTRHFFDDVEEERDFQQLKGQAMVIRHFVGSNYEIRLTIDNVVVAEKSQPLDAGQIIYAEKVWRAQFNESTDQGFDLRVINSLSSI